MHGLVRVTLGLLLATVVAAGAPAQDVPPPEAGQQPLRVFLDCQNLFCDFDHLRRATPWVDWVRDRTVAGVHVLGVAHGTGAGGQEVTLTFIGRGPFAGASDTVRFRTGVTDTDTERREALTRTLGLGLARFAAGTTLGERLQIVYEGPPTAQVPVVDPWNFWVFTLFAGGGLDGEARQRELDLETGVSVNRVTERWKLNLSADIEYSLEEFEVEEDSTLSDRQTEVGFFGLSVWSLGPHWSVGGLMDFERSTFDNFHAAIESGPAIEFSVFPYAESTRRAITIRYAAGAGIYRYREETVFGHLREVRPLHEVDVDVRAQQPWGDMNGGINASQYLHDPALYRVDVRGGISLRIFRGLRFNLFGEFSRVKDQINLPVGDLTPEEILLQRRLLGTDFEYHTAISFSYTFGSIFNNVVNPRF